ncbi:MAG: PAS domain S-box protein, partial [Deltaproteobacteria bacterium]|nr:PAS domain S-box protein [Deltaproteobacteria bacterium]
VPIKKLHKGANAIAGGDFKTRLDIRTGDEIQQLAGAMNEMAEKLDNFYGTLENQVEERTEELKSMLDASKAVLRYHGFTDRARCIFDNAKELIGASAGYVALTSEDGTRNELLFLDPGGRECTVDPSLPMPIRGLREQAYKTGKAVYDNDFSNSEWMKFIPEGHVRLDNVLFAPLMKEEKPIGLIGLANKPRGFNGNDARLLSAFGDIATIALLESTAVEDLKESEERSRVIAETAADAIITMKRPGVVTLWNKSAERIFGYTSDEVIGKNLHDIIVPERYKEKSREGLKNFFETGSGPVVGKTIEITALRKDGSEFPVELSISAMRIGDEWQTAAIVRDITERKRAEEKIKEQLDYLERFQKVAVKREFRIKELTDENEALKKKIEEIGKK